MCGFLAEFSFQEQQTTTHQFENLLALSKHRGPDSSLAVNSKNFQLGFNRLAILDLSENGNQPKQSPSKRYHLVFNGEIYNYKKLEQDFELSNLQSTSDTEVLSHLLDKLGVDKTLRVLNGMFAIAVIDTKTNQFYLARDFAGIKPLFYGIAKEGIVAASQFDQVFRHPWFQECLELRGDLMKEYFAFGYMQAPNTIYKNIYQVNPGEYLKWNREGRLSKDVFKVFNTTITKNKEETEYLDNIKELLQTSVRQQLVSDVPIATFLSGGIDSPLITAMAKQYKENIEAFTVAVEDKELNESEAAKAYADYIKIEHQIEHINEAELLEQIDNHFKGFPEPFGDYSSIPTYLITNKAKRQNTVMLSGDGGDELFFGYPRMLDVIKKRHWYKLPFVIRKPIIRLANKLGFINTWAPYNYRTISEWVREKHTYIFKRDLDRFFLANDFSSELKTLYNFKSSNKKKRLLLDLRTNEFYAHMQRVLIKVDRMSMANSLEVRVPFLDKDVIESAFKYQPKSFTKNTDLKKVLKNMMQDYYPENMINRQKKGFSVPIEVWLKNQLHNDVKKVIFEKPFYGAHLVNVKEIQDYIDDFYADKHNSAWGVWHIYAWQKWAIYKGLI